MTKAGLESLLSTLKEESQMSSNERMLGAGCSANSWMQHSRKESYPIENEQILSLKAMIAYVSHQTGAAEYRIERDFADHFCIPNMKCLPKDLYDKALRYVCDQSLSS